MTARLPSLISLLLAIALIGSPRAAHCAERTSPITSAPSEAASPSEAPSETPSEAPSPADSSAPAPGSDNRWRFQIGMMKIPMENKIIPSVNIDYRWSLGLPRGSAAFGVGFTGEIGVTLLLPYAKAGVELRYSHFFLDAHGGGLIVPVPGGNDIGIFPMPFAGGEVGYLFNLGSHRMELEVGYNFIDEGDPAEVGIAYATAAVTW